MSSERTEKATPKRREDARRKGQIARGAELPAAFSFLGALVVLKLASSEIFGRMSFYIQSSANDIAQAKAFTDGNVHNLFIEAAKILAIFAAPVILVAFTAVLAGNFAQGGLAFSGEALKPKADKFNPAKNIKRIFGLDSVVNLLKSLLKLLFIGAVAYGVLSPVIETAPTLVNAPLPTVAARSHESARR